MSIFFEDGGKPQMPISIQWDVDEWSYLHPKRIQHAINNARKKSSIGHWSYRSWSELKWCNYNANPCGHFKGVTMLQLGKAKIGSLGEEEEEEAQNYLYHIYFSSRWAYMDKMQHGIWIKDWTRGITFLWWSLEGKLSVLVKSQLCLSGEMKSEFNANHV